jgi:hypothetical protein
MPPCPGATQTDHEAARVVASYPEQGWSLLCNGVVIFDDDGELFPDGRALGPRVRTGLALVGRPAASLGITETTSGGHTH